MNKLILALCLVSLFVAIPADATLPTSTTTWEVQPTSGVDTNGGCFIAGATGTDLTYPTSSPVAYTDLVAATTTTITSAATPFSSASVGNCLHIASGSGWTTGWFQIVSVASVTATVDRAIATMGSTGGTGTLGGALKTAIQLSSVMSANHQAWMKAEAIQTGGRWNINFASTGYAAITGYTSTRGDGGYVTLKMNAADFFVVMNASSQNVVLKNFILDCNSTCSGEGLFFQGCCQSAYNIQVKNMGSHVGIDIGSSRNLCAFCYVTGVSGGVNAILINDGMCYFCVAYSNTNTVAVIAMNSAGGGAEGPHCIRCIAANNTSSSSAFNISSNQGPATLLNSIAVNNGGDGVLLSSSTNQFPVMILNNIFVSNTGFGINHSTTTIPPGGDIYGFNAFYSNTNGSYSGVNAQPSDITLTGNPFTNSASNDFSPNNTTGAGALIRSAATPGVLAIGGTSYMDIGALQHADPAAATGSAVGFVQ